MLATINTPKFQAPFGVSLLHLVLIIQGYNQNYMKYIYNLNSFCIIARKDWGYQWGNQKPEIEVEYIIQWLKGNGQKDKQRSTKYYTENWRSSSMNSLKQRGECMCSWRVRGSWCTWDTLRVTLVTNWSFVPKILRKC
jgi:hypothetical protein